MAQSLSDVFSSNVKKLLNVRGWNFAVLASKCDGEYSKAYISSFKYGDKINPTLEVLEVLGKVFNVPPQTLIDPTLDYNRAEAVPEGYIKKTYLLTKSQDFTVSKWEKNNYLMIKLEDEKRFENLQKLAE